MLQTFIPLLARKWLWMYEVIPLPLPFQWSVSINKEDNKDSFNCLLWYVVMRLDLISNRFECKSQIWYLPVWARCWNSVCPSFCICKMGNDATCLTELSWVLSEITPAKYHPEYCAWGQGEQQLSPPCPLSPLWLRTREIESWDIELISLIFPFEFLRVVILLWMMKKSQKHLWKGMSSTRTIECIL